MLTAIRLSNSCRVIGYEIDKDKTESYVCEYCNEVVIHNKSNSQVRIGHFKHKSNLACPNNQKESVEHIRTKRGIKNYLSEKYSKAFHIIELEKWICNKSIRPDIYIETVRGKKIAIEVQASQLTIDQIIDRTIRYAQNNIYVLWVLVWKKSKISSSAYMMNEYFRSHHCDRFCDHTIKLTEMELFIHWMNYKRLILWDFEQTYSDTGFRIVELEKFVGDDAEYYDESGEYQYFEGRVAKNKKIITNLHFDIPFGEFYPSFNERFQVHGKKYELPDRFQMSWKKRK